VVDRFRLIYLKSPKIEDSLSEEHFLGEKEEKKDFKISKTSKEYYNESYSFEIILNQAKADLKHPDPKVRILAVRFLSKCEPSIAIPFLVGILNDEASDIRAYALDALIRFKAPNILNIIRKFLKDNDPEVRITALRGIFQMAEHIELNLLMQFLDDESPIVRKKLATLLGWTQIKGVLPILVELVKDKDSKVRKAALSSLITQYPEEGEEKILEAIADPDPDLRFWAKEMMEKILKKPIKREKIFISNN